MVDLRNGEEGIVKLSLTTPCDEPARMEINLSGDTTPPLAGSDQASDSGESIDINIDEMLRDVIHVSEKHYCVDQTTMSLLVDLVTVNSTDNAALTTPGMYRCGIRCMVAF